MQFLMIYFAWQVDSNDIMHLHTIERFRAAKFQNEFLLRIQKVVGRYKSKNITIALDELKKIWECLDPETQKKFGLLPSN